MENELLPEFRELIHNVQEVSAKVLCMELFQESGVSFAFHEQRTGVRKQMLKRNKNKVLQRWAFPIPNAANKTIFHLH
jgi:hypothetical protein